MLIYDKLCIVVIVGSLWLGRLSHKYIKSKQSTKLMFGVVILSSIEENGSLSRFDMLSAGISLLSILSSSHGFYCFPSDSRIHAVVGYKFIFIPIVLGTFYMTLFNTLSAIEYSAYGRHRNCGFGFAYTAFMKGTPEGFITGIFGVFVGTGFIYLTLQNIFLTRQALNLYRCFRDDHYRRRG